jgi:mannose-6-phosphate isomerase-like protein (cupin superfamily)
MITKKIKEIEAFTGHEYTQIRQIFSPIETDNAIRYSIAHCTINPGNSSKPHTMKTSEVYYILEGKGIMHLGKEQKQITKDETIFIPPNSEQYLENVGETDLIALCIVDPAWRQEDEVTE